MTRQDSRRRQCDCRNRAIRGINPHSAEQDVPDYVTSRNGYQRYKHDTFLLQTFHEIRLVDAPEGCDIDGPNR
jgi:hypothetical protein